MFIRQTRIKNMIINVFDFGDSVAKDIMIPKVRMVSVDVNFTYDEVLAKQLQVMDLPATSLALENKIPAVVFPLADPNNILRAIRGEDVGTKVTL